MPAPSESAEAKALASYLNALVQYKQIICYTKTAQETFTTSWGAKMRQKAEGVQKGIPDYVILAKTKVIFLELKKQKGKRGGNNGSVISPEQQLWIDILNNYQSKEIVATIAHGADEAIKFIRQHI
jgi:hypothetical protein